MLYQTLKQNFLKITTMTLVKIVQKKKEYKVEDKHGSRYKTTNANSRDLNSCSIKAMCLLWEVRRLS